MIVHPINRRSKVDYVARHICCRLGQLSFSYQQGRFSADHLDDEAGGIIWTEQTWPEILRVAHQKQAVYLFDDEASFAQWRNLGYV